jgi:polyhydroxyalkanoate synthesis regulator phasin
MEGRAFGPLIDVRSVITLARREGERLAQRVSRDVQAFVLRGPADFAADVERRLTRASTAVLRRFSAATRSEVDALTERIALLEKRLGTLERRRRGRRKPNQMLQGP